MNNRQKAKHWKRLYEESLPQKPYPVVLETHPLQHFSAKYSVPRMDRDIFDNPDTFINTVTNQLISQFKAYLKDSVIISEDIKRDRMEFELSIWLRK